MSDHEHVRGVSASALPSQPQSNLLSSFCLPGRAEGPYEGLFISSLPRLQASVSHRHREAPVPGRQWEHLHTGLELSLPTGDIWLFNQLRHKIKS